MSKPAFVEMAEKDIDFEADRVIKGLCDYAEKNLFKRDFILKMFLKTFRKKVNVESEEENGET